MKNMMQKKDILWSIIWFITMFLILIWNVVFLNKPAFKLIQNGFVNTILISSIVIVITLIAGWLISVSLYFLSQKKNKVVYLFFSFLLNIIRSIPQVVGILFGYIIMNYLIQNGVIQSNIIIFIMLATIMSIFIFVELVDLMRERIEHYKQLDFFNAMLVCGVSEKRIINFDILWKYSRVHILNKLISIFGMAVFLQCSVDFIISVGLSTDVSAVNLPVTLGSLLAKIDSKQDILAIGYSITHPSYIGHLFFEHLQGVTVAFITVFTLLCIYKISNGYSERHRL